MDDGWPVVAVEARDALDWLAQQARGLSGLMKHAQGSQLDFNQDDMAVFVGVLDSMAERAEAASYNLSEA